MLENRKKSQLQKSHIPWINAYCRVGNEVYNIENSCQIFEIRPFFSNTRSQLREKIVIQISVCFPSIVILKFETVFYLPGVDKIPPLE